MEGKQNVVEIIYVRSAGKTLLCNMRRALVSGFTLSPSMIRILFYALKELSHGILSYFEHPQNYC